MIIRTICFLGAVLASNPWRWFLILGAVLLPYLAVVIANAGREIGPEMISHETKKSID